MVAISAAWIGCNCFDCSSWCATLGLLGFSGLLIKSNFNCGLGFEVAMRRNVYHFGIAQCGWRN